MTYKTFCIIYNHAGIKLVYLFVFLHLRCFHLRWLSKKKKSCIPVCIQTHYFPDMKLFTMNMTWMAKSCCFCLVLIFFFFFWLQTDFRMHSWVCNSSLCVHNSVKKGITLCALRVFVAAQYIFQAQYCIL